VNPYPSLSVLIKYKILINFIRFKATQIIKDNVGLACNR
jgi:hypothetical protein